MYDYFFNVCVLIFICVGASAGRWQGAGRALARGGAGASRALAERWQGDGAGRVMASEGR